MPDPLPLPLLPDNNSMEEMEITLLLDQLHLQSVQPIYQQSDDVIFLPYAQVQIPENSVQGEITITDEIMEMCKHNGSTCTQIFEAEIEIPVKISAQVKVERSYDHTVKLPTQKIQLKLSQQSIILQC